ncbi:hypothetical protein ACFX10_021662 [Malus domestica]
MICEGFRPNIVAYTTRIHDLCTNGKMGDAVSACYEMERNGSPRPHKALLLMALQKQVPLLAALHLYNMMNHGCRLNEFLDGLFKANRFEEAYGIVREIEEIRMGLNLETYNTTLNGFSSGWNANEAMQLLGKMLVRGRKPDTITYNTIIYANCKQGSISTARVSTLLAQKRSGNQM